MISVAPDVDLSKVAALGESLLAELDRLREFDPIHWSPVTGACLKPRAGTLQTRRARPSSERWMQNVTIEVGR